MTTQDNQEKLLTKWLLDQAAMHSVSIAHNDPAVQTHIKQLQEWAADTQSMDAELRGAYDELNKFRAKVAEQQAEIERLKGELDDANAQIQRQAALMQSVQLSAQQVPEVKYGCHCDLEPHMEPDGCVIDEDRRDDCIYANRVSDKTQCKYWKPIKFSAAPIVGQGGEKPATSERKG